MERKTGKRVSAGDDWNPVVVQNFRHVEHSLEGILEALVHAVRDFQSSIEKAAAHLRRHEISHRGVASRHLARTVIQHAFKNAERGVQNNFAVFQKLDESLNLTGL